MITMAGTRPRAAASRPNTTAPDVAEQAVAEADVLSHLEGDDPHLRSLSAVTGNDIEAADGAIGHLENVLLEDDGWGARYLIIDTRNWWPGQHVLVSPYSCTERAGRKRRFFLTSPAKR